MSEEQRRLRVFAGPNGSGKTTMIDAIRKRTVRDRPIDFGIYVNADDIAESLSQDSFHFADFALQGGTRDQFVEYALGTGLIGERFPLQEFLSCFSTRDNGDVILQEPDRREHLAQLLATLLRDRLLQDGRKLSIETVFSHPSKLALLHRAKALGYRIYLYYVATESPEINIARIKEVRVRQGGHDVPDDTVRARYERAMDLLYDAAEYAWQVYFFDNSRTGETSRFEPFAHFRREQGRKVWDPIIPDQVPRWFDRYYLQKIPSQ